jgi:ketosteroid isomerase-like protein
MTAEQGTGADTDAVAVVEELNRRFLAGDRDGAFALFAPDVRIRQPASLPHGGDHVGHDGVGAMGRAFAEHWDRTIVDPRVSGTGAGAGSGGLVVQVTTQTWTAKATGRSATVEVVELLTVLDGRVAEIRVFPQDTHGLLATLP